jgi:hippurate hydrolase
MDLLRQANSLGPDLIAVRRRLHAAPELALRLPVTQRLVLAALDGLGLEISTGRALSSVTAVLRGTAGPPGSGPVVLLRADMDALPVTERTELSYAPAADSPHHGSMHACGHDLHMAGLIGAARLLADRRADLAGDVVFMFQPGEEGYDGASVMMRRGCSKSWDAAPTRHTACTCSPGTSRMGFSPPGRDH